VHSGLSLDGADGVDRAAQINRRAKAICAKLVTPGWTGLHTHCSFSTAQVGARCSTIKPTCVGGRLTFLKGYQENPKPTSFGFRIDRTGPMSRCRQRKTHDLQDELLTFQSARFPTTAQEHGMTWTAMTYMPTSDASDFFALLSSHTSGGQSLFSRAEKPVSLRDHGHDVPTDSDVFRSAHNPG
jgi:hypothetical protein